MRRQLSLLMLVVFAVRSLLPVGFMLQPSAAGHGGLAIVICTGHGAETVFVDADGKPAKSNKPAQPDASRCPYSAANSASPLADVPTTLVAVVHEAAVAYVVTESVYRTTPQPSANSARGPPTRLA